MSKRKIHFRSVCAWFNRQTYGWAEGRTTENLEEVTCKRCINGEIARTEHCLANYQEMIDMYEDAKAEALEELEMYEKRKKEVE